MVRHHCQPYDIVIFLWITPSLQKFYAAHFSICFLVVDPSTQVWYVPICGYGLVTLGKFEVVPLREIVPGIFMLPRVGGYQLVHGPGLCISHDDICI